MIRALFAVSLAALLGAAPAAAQYMFLDFDGDGQYTSSDWYAGYPRSGDTTRVDLYIVTNGTQYGDPAPTCPEDGSGIGINGYTVNLLATSASISVAGVQNRMQGMAAQTPPAIAPYAVSVSYAGTVMYPAGTYLALSLDVVFQPDGCPALNVVASSCFTPPGVVTAIWSNCLGNDLDSILKMGSDWDGALGSIGCNDGGPQTPSVTCPETVAATVGEPIQFTVSVDAKGCYGVDAFYVEGLPDGATLSDLSAYTQGHATAAFAWTPAFTQTGEFDVRFIARNNCYFCYPIPYVESACTARITVSPASRLPTAVSGGPYHGVQGVPLQFDGSGSSDPDGDALAYAWSFGDGAIAASMQPLHTYAAGGVFPVQLRVTDPGGLFDLDSTTATIARDIAVRVFTSSSNDPTRLGKGKPQTCFQVEATDGSFTPEQIVPTSLYLSYIDPVCGELDAYTSGAKTAMVDDTDKNGVPEYTACFSREALQTLGTCMTEGSHTVRLEVHGALATGESIHGEVEHTFLSTGPLQVAVTPNPVNAASRIEFTTRAAGRVSVRVFDIRGRLSATLAEEPSMAPGRHQVSFMGRDGAGSRLASGVYFVRVFSESDGEEIRRITVLR